VSDKTIRVSKTNWQRLRDLKREGESFNDVIERLTTDDKWQGFGALSDTDVTDEMATVDAELEAELDAETQDT
jgi:predicted CopG family antitoxin